MKYLSRLWIFSSGTGEDRIRSLEEGSGEVSNEFNSEWKLNLGLERKSV
ncbi:hypothetical protein [Leptospira meyeri]|nr:hypothetical protein [Leptospira meyeri]